MSKSVYFRSRLSVSVAMLIVMVFATVESAATAREVLGGHEGWLDRMGAGIREAGMGNAAGAVEDAVPAAYWNPALLPFGGKPVVGFGADVRALQRNGGFVALQGRAASNMGMGLGLVNRGDYSVPAYSGDEEYLGTARPQAVASFLGLGFKTSRRNSVGAAVQWYSSNLDVDGRTGNINQIGIFNLGWYRAWTPALRTGVVVRNLGLNEKLSGGFSQITLGEDAGDGFEQSSQDFLPKTVIASVHYLRELKGKPWSFALELLDYQLKDALFVVDRNFHHVDVRAGVENQILEPLWLRAGYDKGNLSLGFTYAYMWGKRPISVDYAVIVEKGFLHVNPFALGVRFPL